MKRQLRRRKLSLHTKIYLFIIIVVLINMNPLRASADLLGYEIQDIYVEITDNVRETNEILDRAFQFTQISPYSIISNLSGSFPNQAKILHDVHLASITMSLIVATLLLMVDFFRKTVNFEWSSKWENVLIFLIKIIVIKQVVQNADVIMGYIYQGFNYINLKAIHASMEFLPFGSTETYTWTDEDGVMTKMVKKGWWDFWMDVGAGSTRTTYSYEISQDAVRMFYPNAQFPGRDLNSTPLPNPTTAVTFMPTMSMILLQPYFWIMKAIAYIVFVIATGRVFELCIYTIFAPLPLATFASDTTHDVAKSFIKNYIAVVLQVSMIVVMFIVYLAVNTTVQTSYPGMHVLKLVALISLGLGVVKSNAWSKKICGIG